MNSNLDAPRAKTGHGATEDTRGLLHHRCTLDPHPVRNQDPCISCPTHFLDLTVERTGNRVGSA